MTPYPPPTLRLEHQPLSTLERAIALAAVAHAGQIDKGGAPYILHPLRVMQRVDGAAARMAAVLHDVVEDTPLVPAQLRELGFDEVVVAAVAALTKRPDEAHDYFAFVERAGSDDVARAVKLADIEDNLDVSRIPVPTARDQERLVRYRRARKLLHVIGRERGDRAPVAPTVLPLGTTVTTEALEAECPGTRPVLATDFHVAGAEGWEVVPGGLRRGRIVNVDHHAALAAMEAPVTSTALAHEYLRHAASDGPAPWVVINHTDCDSVLASALLLGHLAPDETLVAAARAADHTGDEHPVADLLQALDEAREGDRTEAQYLASLRHLHRLLAGEAPEPGIVPAMAARRARRAAARRLVSDGRVRVRDGVALGVLEEEIDGAFFPALLPEAALILLASRHPRDPVRWVVKLRLGLAAPPGLTLHALGPAGWDPAFGGRWNAGSNKRGGGTDMEPTAYAARLAEALRVPTSVRGGATPACRRTRG